MTRKQFIAKYSGGHYGDAKSLEQKVAELAGLIFDNFQPVVEVVTANRTLTAEDTGKVFLCATDNVVFTLPATVAGLKYTFINSGADGAAKISISPAADDAIHGTTTASTNVVLSGVDNKDAINTKATATTGDNLTIVGDGSVGWYVVGAHGIWASE